MNPVEEIKNRLDIVETISGYINLQPAGGNFRAVCPFHNEKTPSFMVSKEKQIWHCFGCDKGGDIIGFIQEYEGLSFPEALKLLAQRANVPLPQFSSSHQEDYSRFYTINQTATDFYHQKLLSDTAVAKKVREYLTNRQTTSESIERWRLGLSGEDWDELYLYLQKQGFKDEDVFGAGLIVKKKSGVGYVDRFRRRLMFPIADSQGRIVAFTSRTLYSIAYQEEDIGGKYINSPQTAVYDKSKTLYGWPLAKDAIRQKAYLIIVEGNMDTILAHQTSAKNTVAVSGTALTLDHIKLIKRYTNNLILAFDGDAAGSRAAFRSITLCWQEELNVKILLLPKDQDPADIIKIDPALWLKAIKESVPVMDYYFQRILAGVDLTRSDHKKIAAQKILPIIKYLKSNIEQAHYLQLLSDKLQIPLEVLRQDLGQTKSFLENQEATVVKVLQNKKDWLLLMSEQILAMAFYKNEYINKLISEVDPEILSPELQGLYKKVIIYYTKHQNLDNFTDYQELDKSDKEYWIKLSLFGEDNYSDFNASDLSNDWQNLVNRLKFHFLDSERKIFIGKLRQAELDHDSAGQDQLSHQINLLNKEIHKLQR